MDYTTKRALWWKHHIQVPDYKSALLDLQLAEGTGIVVSFKSTAIHTF